MLSGKKEDQIQRYLKRPLLKLLIRSSIQAEGLLIPELIIVFCLQKMANMLPLKTGLLLAEALKVEGQ